MHEVTIHHYDKLKSIDSSGMFIDDFNGHDDNNFLANSVDNPVDNVVDNIIDRYSTEPQTVPESVSESEPHSVSHSEPLNIYKKEKEEKK